MGFFDVITQLLDEKSPNSFENKISSALDDVERALGATVSTLDQGVQKVESVMGSVSNGTENLVSKSEQAIGKLDQGSQRMVQSIDGMVPGGKR